MPFCCTPRRLQLFCTFLTVVAIVAILVVLFIFNWPTFARQRIIENVIFKNGTMEMDRFQSTSELKNLRLSIYVYNVTNVDEVIRSSAKMKLQEIGPFVYYETKTKEFLENNQTSGLITYKLLRKFVFKPELSVGDARKMNITWLNVPVISAIKYIDNLNVFFRSAASIIFQQYINTEKETPFITDSVEKFIFSGSFRKLFARMEANTIIKSLLGPRWPLPDNKFAVLYKKNNTWLPNRDYLFTTSAGFGLNQNYSDLNQYKLMNGSSILPFWKPRDSVCNQFYGTDGEFFSPFLDSSKTLQVYSMDICRKLALRFSREVIIDGISVYKYTLDERSFLSPLRYPENRCYCLEKSMDECSLDGLVDLSICSAAPEVFASGSHFIHGSPELAARLNGIRPANATLDEPYIYIEPNTGLSIQVRVPIQFNVRLSKHSNYSIFSFFNDLNPLIVPLLHVTEAAELDDAQASLLRRSLLILDSWFVSMVLGGAILLIIVIIVIIAVLCLRLAKSRRQSPAHHTERDPLLSSTNSRRQPALNHSASSRTLSQTSRSRPRSKSRSSNQSNKYQSL